MIVFLTYVIMIFSQILVAALKFFLGKDEDEAKDSGSESEVDDVIHFTWTFLKSGPFSNSGCVVMFFCRMKDQQPEIL